MAPNAEKPGTIRARAPHISSGVPKGFENEVMIDGEWYNIDSFAKKHPGGRIINFYRGKDASEAFTEFHMRSSKAQKWLKSLDSRPDNGTSKADSKLDPLTKDFVDLRNQLEKEGFFDVSYTHVAYRIAEIIALEYAGFSLIFSGLPIFGLMLIGLATGRSGWLMHEGGHNSLTGNITLDHIMQVIIYGVGCGMSGSWWRNQHNKHHATPQKVDHDVDLDTLPLVMFNMKVKDGKQKNLMNKNWIKFQAYLFTPVTCLLVSMFWQLYLHPRHALRTKRFGELAAMAVRYAIVAAMIPATGASALSVVAGYIFSVWVGGVYIFTNFAVSHSHKPVLAPEEDVSWVRYASDHTMNVDSGPFNWVNWWMSYLNYQIEHHLFPSMPQFRHPQVSPRVRALFEKHGVEYDSRSYVDALKVTFANLDQVGHDVWLG